MQYKKSKQRDRILQILSETDSHPTADWIYEKLKKELPELSLATVYRNLNVLAGQGLVNRMTNGATFDRFDARLSLHYHLTCEKCGSVEDIIMPEPSQLIQDANRLGSFEIKKHRIDFFGICKSCQNKAGLTDKPY